MTARVYRVTLHDAGGAVHVVDVHAGTRNVASSRAIAHAPAGLRRPFYVAEVRYLPPDARKLHQRVIE